MLNININSLSNKAGDRDISSFILPLSGQKLQLHRIVIGEDKKTNSYQTCDKCNDTTGHLDRVVEGIDYKVCVKCSHGYKISR